MAPHHPIPNTKFPPITASLKLAFPLHPVLQDFPARFFTLEFPARFSHKIFSSWILIGWLPITLFQMITFHQSLPFLNWLFPNDKFPQPCPARFQTDFPVRFPAEFPSRFSLKNFPQDFPTRFSCKNFLQEFPTIFSCKIFPQDFSELDPDWLAPHHPIPNAKFPPITAFLKLAFSPRFHFSCPAEFPSRFSLQDFPHKNFLQEFPIQDFPQSWILIGWLPITLFQMLNLSLPFFWLFPLNPVLQISHKIFRKNFHKI